MLQKNQQKKGTFHGIRDSFGIENVGDERGTSKISSNH